MKNTPKPSAATSARPMLDARRYRFSGPSSVELARGQHHADHGSGDADELHRAGPVAGGHADDDRQGRAGRADGATMLMVPMASAR